MLNIASVNMPKIKPETKVLIMKNLKSKSPAEVTDISMCLNGWWRRFASATKRLPASMTDPGRADHARQLLETTACWSVSQLQEEWMPATPVPSRTARQILAHNGLHGRIAAHKPALNKKQLRNRNAKAHSLTEGWTTENVIFQMNRQLSSIPSEANIVNDPQGPIWTHGSHRRQSNLEGQRLWFWVTSNTEVPGRSVRWMVTLIVPNINRFLPPSTFPTTRGVSFFNRMELLAIPQVPR